MTENNDLPEQHPQEPEQELPGIKLREAREARGLSCEEVAAQLRLQPRLINALEENDYDALPSQAFASGYLRSYARLLELPEDVVVAPVTSKREPPPLVSTAASRKQASSSDWLTRLVTFVVIGAIPVAVLVWWLGQRQIPEPEATLPKPEVVEQGADQNLMPPEAATQLTGEETEQPAETGGVEVQADATAPVTEPAEEEPVQAVAEERSEPEASGPAPLTEAMPQSKLELRYEADSWTEVNDNAGRQLAYGLIRAGQVLVLRGEAPFRVFLGYAPGVAVYYNNELFDHSPFQRRDVARFRIGRAEHNHPGSR